MDIKTLDAESKKVSKLIKNGWGNKIRKAMITVSASIIIATAAFQQVSAQTRSHIKDEVQMIADYTHTSDFTDNTVTDQQILLINLIEASSDKIQQQFSEHLNRLEFNDAEMDVEFFDTVAVRTKDPQMKAWVDKLRSDLNTEKKKFEQMNKDIHNQIHHNNVKQGSIQVINGSKYATFTDNDKNLEMAGDIAKIGLRDFLTSNKLDSEQLTPGRKIEQQGRLFVVTVYVLINQ